MLSRVVRKRAEGEGGPEVDAEGPKPPPRKLARRSATAAERGASAALRLRESALFRPARALGVVTGATPFSHAKLGDANFIVTAVGRGFQVFECEKLQLAYIGPRLNEKVRAVHTVGEATLTAMSADIVVWHKLTELGRFRGHVAPATLMCNIGAGYLVSSSGAETFVWPLSDIGMQPAADAVAADCVVEPLGSIDAGSGFGSCTSMCHLPTYLHKIVLGFDSGHVGLWNVRTRDRIHKFRSHLADGKGKGCGAVTCMIEVPNALDLLVLGFASGRIVVLNAKEDKVVLELQQAQGRITSMSIRTGSGVPAHLVTGAPNGAVVVWDLDKRRAHHVIDAAHNGPISTVCFLPNQPILITSGSDNALKMWIFDTADGLPRPLKTRCGCPGPAKFMEFYGDGDDKEMLVGGRCDGGGFLSRISFIFDRQNQEFAQTALKKMPNSLRIADAARLPPLLDMVFCEARHYDWPAVVTAHERLDAALVWSAHHKTLAPEVLRPPEGERAPVSAVAVSTCGNYVVLGLENGALHRFNLQSQLYRGCFPKVPDSADPAKPVPTGPAPRAHRGRVCGLVITAAGQVISAGSHPEDCGLRLWKLTTHEPVQTVPLDDGRSGKPSVLLLKSHGALVAAGLDDGALLVADLHGAAVVRSFACGAPATCLAFSSDGRWLAAALRSGGMRVFDLPAARCVDSFAFARPVLSLCFSPSTAFLLTSHAKGNSIQVWANKFLFDPSLSAPLLQPEPTQPVQIDEPGDPGLMDLDEDSDDGEDLPTAPVAEVSAAQLEPELFTLSDVPPAKWQATLHLDLVKERNKAKEAPKALPNAPFFLPTAFDGVKPHFLAPAADEDEENAGSGAIGASRHMQGARGLDASMPVQTMLATGDFDGVLKFLKAQTPSGVHLAIEELGPMAGGDAEELSLMLKFFVHHMRKGHYADELQAYLSLFLQAHGEELAATDKLRAQCGEMCALQTQLWTSLDARCQKMRCFLGTLTHTQSQW